MTVFSDAQRLVRDLLVSVDQLSANVYGTRLPYRPTSVSPETRARRDAEARQERHERIDVAPGDSPDPYSFPVADLLVEILAEADSFAEQVAQAAGVDRLPSASSAYADPAPYLRHIRDWLEQADEAVPGMAADVLHRFAPLRMRAEELLGHVMDGQQLAGACPSCGGKTDRMPTGGDRTLRIRMSREDEPQPLVVCEGGRCAPSEAQCGNQWRGHPAWRLFAEGDWFAMWMTKGDDRLCRCGRKLAPTGKRGRPAEHCSDECRRDADAERQRLRRAS